MKLDTCHFGDVRAVLREMIAAGVQVNTIVTSPPYWGLRSYLPAGHPDKAFEIGSEPTIGEFITGMVEVFELCRQVLRDDGTMWVNMGDSYAGSWGAQSRGGNSGAVSAMSARQANVAPRGRRVGALDKVPGLKPKDLVGQPWRLAFALQDAGWWLRQDIIWNKPAPMPESTRDRCTKAHEYIFLLAKSEKYYYDFDAMQEPVTGGAHARRSIEATGLKRPGFGRGFDAEQKPRYKTADGWAATPQAKVPAGWATGTGRSHNETLGRYSGERKLAASGSGTKNNVSMDAALEDVRTTRNRRSVWTVHSKPYKGAHFATFPPELIEPCILAGCPVGGIVLDPFFGSGTTGQVAQQLGRHFLGIDINRANEPLQAERLRQPALLLEVA